MNDLAAPSARRHRHRRPLAGVAQLAARTAPMWLVAATLAVGVFTRTGAAEVTPVPPPASASASASARASFDRPGLGIDDAGARFDRAATLRRTILAQIRQEDAPRRRGPPKTRTTEAQVAGELATAEQASAQVRHALERGDRVPATLAVFVNAVAALREAYLASAMESTDGAVAEFAPGPDLDVLGSDTAHAKIARWQRASRDSYNGTIKFSVPPPHVTGRLECRIGNPMAVGHNQVAGGDAVAAGFIRVDVTGYVVTAYENTSGGYRPGSLRNETARAAIAAAGPARYTIAENARHDNPTGSYDTSVIDRP